MRKRDPEKHVGEAGPSNKRRLTSTVNIDLSTDELEEADIAAMTTWLKYHNSPVDQVKEMMLKTCRYRTGKIRSEKEKPLRELLGEYPRLLDTDGMIEQDFRVLFPEVCDSLYMKWPNLFKKVLQYADKQVNWKRLLDFSGKVDSDDEQSTIALQVLPLLFPTGSKRKEGKKGPNQRATVEEALRSFVQVEKVGTNLPEFLENVVPTQPFVLLLGERNNPEQTFVVIERQTVKCVSLLQAVDVCSKLFYLLDVQYPWECQNTWDFFQQFIFGLGEGKGRGSISSAVSLLCNFLKRK